jgi:hypothetical protein
MKVLFLDIDGVLISKASVARFKESHPKGRSMTPFRHFDPVHADILNKIIEKTGAKIVISSVWRFHPKDELMANFREVNIPTNAIIGKTPRSNNLDDVRGNEIQQWLDAWEGEPIESFVILDDDSDMAHLLPRLIKTSSETGLLEEHIERTIEILNTQGLK